jgi:hypothetical protein
MLRQSIALCPDPVWTGSEHRNAPWQIAYHTLFFAHLYSRRSEHDFTPWEGHQAENQNPDAIPGPPDPDSDLPHMPEPYSREQVLAYCDFCDAIVDASVDVMDVLASESGFHWYPIPKLDHQIVNVRHIQHGAAQLADRVRAATDTGVDWVGARPATSGAGK